MGLKEAITAGVNAGFRALGNIPRDVIYRRVTGTTYNPSAEVPVDVSSDTTIQAIYSDESVSMQHMGATQSNDSSQERFKKTYLLRQSALSFRPASQDLIVDGANVFVIVDVSQDSAGATWSLAVELQP